MFKQEREVRIRTRIGNTKKKPGVQFKMKTFFFILADAKNV